MQKIQSILYVLTRKGQSTSREISYYTKRLCNVKIKSRDVTGITKDHERYGNISKVSTYKTVLGTTLWIKVNHYEITEKGRLYLERNKIILPKKREQNKRNYWVFAILLIASVIYYIITK